MIRPGRSSARAGFRPTRLHEISVTRHCSGLASPGSTADHRPMYPVRSVARAGARKSPGRQACPADLLRHLKRPVSSRPFSWRKSPGTRTFLRHLAIRCASPQRECDDRLRLHNPATDLPQALDSFRLTGTRAGLLRYARRHRVQKQMRGSVHRTPRPESPVHQDAEPAPLQLQASSGASGQEAFHSPHSTRQGPAAAHVRHSQCVPARRSTTGSAPRRRICLTDYVRHHRSSLTDATDPATGCTRQHHVACLMASSAWVFEGHDHAPHDQSPDAGRARCSSVGAVPRPVR